MSLVLVTGATGFVGQHVVNYLQKNNLEFICASRTHELYGESPTIFLDLDDPESYRNLLKYKFEHVIHLAWSGLPNYLANRHLVKELPNQINFLTWLINKGITNLTVTGTCFEYGMQEGELSESTICEPVTYYGIAKNALRQYLLGMQQFGTVKFNLKWLRLFYVYGPGQAEKSLYSQLKAAITNDEKIFNMSPGDQQRDFIHISNAAKYIVDCTFLNDMQGILNVCSGKPMSVVDFVKQILLEYSSDIKLNLGFYDYPIYEPKCFWGTGRLESLGLDTSATI